jgi:hypothetical protein
LAICSAFSTEASEAFLDARLEDGAIDDGFDGVVFALLENRRVREVANLAIDAGAEALLIELVEQILEFAFAAADDGRVRS